MRLRRTGILTKLILLVLAVYAIVALSRLRGQIENAQAQTEELQKQVAELTVENDEMQYAIDNSDDDDVIRDIAREKLNLVEPGEEVYYAG